MDLSKLEGLVEAIEKEAKIPAPSHQNLARLVAMFFREALSFTEKMKCVKEPARLATNTTTSASNITEGFSDASAS